MHFNFDHLIFRQAPYFDILNLKVTPVNIIYHNT